MGRAARTRCCIWNGDDPRACTLFKVTGIHTRVTLKYFAFQRAILPQIRFATESTPRCDVLHSRAALKPGNFFKVTGLYKSFRGWRRGGGDPFAKGSLPHKKLQKNKTASCSCACLRSGTASAPRVPTCAGGWTGASLPPVRLRAQSAGHAPASSFSRA